jgi:hypothetical protein
LRAGIIVDVPEERREMNLQSELDTLAHKIASFHEPTSIADTEWQEFVENTTISLNIYPLFNKSAHIWASYILIKLYCCKFTCYFTLKKLNFKIRKIIHFPYLINCSKVP